VSDLDVATQVVRPRDRAAELEHELTRLARRGTDLAAGPLKTTEQRERLEATRAEYKRVHGQRVRAKNQMCLFSAACTGSFMSHKGRASASRATSSAGLFDPVPGELVGERLAHGAGSD